MKEVVNDVATYLKDIAGLWDFVHELMTLLSRTYKVQRLYLHDHLSAGGPFLCICDLYTSEQCPSREEFLALAESLRRFPFPITCRVLEQEFWGKSRNFFSLQLTIQYGFISLN